VYRRCMLAVAAIQILLCVEPRQLPTAGDDFNTVVFLVSQFPWNILITRI
jgi:hypothetical protein